MNNKEKKYILEIKRETMSKSNIRNIRVQKEKKKCAMLKKIDKEVMAKNFSNMLKNN